MKKDSTADALREVAYQIKELGKGNANEDANMGAVEFLAVKVGKVADAINNLAAAVREIGRR